MTTEMKEEVQGTEQPQHTLHIMGIDGDTRYQWDTGDRASVDVARAAFEAGKQKGMLAYSVTAGGGRGEVVREFDPEAGSLVMTPQLQGG